MSKIDEYIPSKRIRCFIEETRIGILQDLKHREDLILVTDNQDVDAIKEQFGNPIELKEFDGFLVKVEEGELEEVYGFEGVPFWHKTAWKVEMKCEVQ